MGSRPARLLRSSRLLPAVCMAACALLAACGMAEDREEAFFDLEADPALTSYSRVTVILQDSLGNPQATLYDDSLRSLREWRKLPAGPYRGGAARIVILGWKDGEPMYRETRVYDGESGRVVAVDIHLGTVDTAIGPQAVLPKPPALEASMPDTVVSIRDSVVLWAFAADADGDLAGYALDCDGDGTFEDSAAISGHRAEIKRGRRFADSGSHACGLKIWDKGARSARGRLAVRVEWDPPWADAGRDTTVEVGASILLHARGEDRFGPIVSREWKIGAKPFVPVPQQETVQEAPNAPGPLPCILRVTDSDGLTAEDTLLVTVIPRTSAP